MAGSSLLVLEEDVTPPAPIRLPLDYREAANWQGRRLYAVMGVVEHIGVAPTFTSLVDYLAGPNAPEVSATFVIGGDYVGQWGLLVGSGLAYPLSKEKLIRAANHAGIQTWPNTNPRPDIGNPNWWTIGKEHVGYPGQIWTAAMVQNDKDCNTYLRSLLGDSCFQYVLGHFNFDPINRLHCPGPTFPWAAIYGTAVKARIALGETQLVKAMQRIPEEKLKQLPLGDHDAYDALLKEYL